MKMRVNVSNGIEFSWNYDDMPKLTIRTFFDEIEKQMRVDLTGFVIMCIDVWYGKGSNSDCFTRCGVEVPDFHIMNWSKSLGPIHDGVYDETAVDADILNWDPKARKDIEVEFMDVTFSDINDMINWLRIKKNVFYTPPKDEKYEWVPKEELECLKKRHKEQIKLLGKELGTFKQFFIDVCEELDTTPDNDPEMVLDELCDNLKRLDDLEDEKASLNSQLNTYSNFVRDTLTALGISGARDYSETRRRIETLRQGYDSCKDWSYALQNLYTDIFDLAEDDWDIDDPPSAFADKILRRFKELKKMEYEHYHVTHDRVRVTALEETLNDLCDENDVVRPCTTRNYRERLEYIFEVLTNWRKRAVRSEHEYNECVKANTKDYANAKCARAELAHLYKRILGEERLDPKLSPHEVAMAILKHVQGLCDLQHEANMGVKELQKFRDEVYNALNLGYPTTNQHILKVLKERLTANDFYVESIDAAEYRAFVMRLFEAVGKPVVDEYIHTNYLALHVLEDVKELKRQNDRGITYVRRMRELEQKLEDIKNICDGDSDILNIIGE